MGFLLLRSEMMFGVGLNTILIIYYRQNISQFYLKLTLCPLCSS